MKRMWMTSFIAVVLLAGCSFGASDEAESKSEEPDTEEVDEAKKKEDSSEDGSAEENAKSSDPKKQQEESEEPTTLSDVKAKQAVMDYEETFKNGLQVIKDQPNQTQYETIEDVVKDFRNAMSEKLANDLAQAFIQNENGELSVLGRGGPAFLRPEQSYTVNKEGQNYVVSQKQSSELNGNATVLFTLIWDKDQWVVHEIHMEKVEQATSNQTDSQRAVKEVRRYLNMSEDAPVKVEVDHEQDGRFLVHVYEVVEQDGNSHTATRGWYYVDKATWEVTDMMNP